MSSKVCVCCAEVEPFSAQTQLLLDIEVGIVISLNKTETVEKCSRCNPYAFGLSLMKCSVMVTQLKL